MIKSVNARKVTVIRVMSVGTVWTRSMLRMFANAFHEYAQVKARAEYYHNPEGESTGIVTVTVTHAGFKKLIKSFGGRERFESLATGIVLGLDWANKEKKIVIREKKVRSVPMLEETD